MIVALSICGYEKSLLETQNQLNTPYSIKTSLRAKKTLKLKDFMKLIIRLVLTLQKRSSRLLHERSTYIINLSYYKSFLQFLRPPNS